MDPSVWQIAAAVLLLATAAVHSWLGEKLIFARWRDHRIFAAGTDAHLAQRHLRILQPTWHIVSLFAGALAVVILTLPREIAHLSSALAYIACIFAILSSGLAVGLSTHWRHPGWFALVLVSLLLTAGLLA